MAEVVIVVVLFLLPPAAVAAAVVARAMWPRALTNGVLGAVLLLAGLVALAWAAVATDFRDADGFFDCGANCTLLQETVGVAVFYGPVLMAALVVGTAAYLGVASRRRSRGARA